MRNFSFRLFPISAAVLAAAFLVGCGPTATPTTPNGVDLNEVAARVNGKEIKMEEVERAVKQQAQGQEANLSPLELAGARLQVLQGLVEQEVMFQKAEKEQTVPTDEEVNSEVNKRKVESRLSAEEFDKQMKAAGLDEAGFKDNVKRGLAIQKLIDKITSRIETPKDSEIAEFFKGNPDLFKRKRGVRLAAIVIDPSNGGEGDLTTNEEQTTLRVKELFGKLQQPGSDFGSLVQEYSEDPSKFRGGDLGYLSEEQLKAEFPQLAAGFMNPQFSVGQITNVVPIGGKFYIFKLQERIEKDEDQTLDSPGVKPQITDLLVNNRKQLLAASFQAMAMNEAKIENYLARKVVENPNELSGARPAPVATPTVENTNSNSANAANTANTANTSNSSNANAANANTASNTNTKPAAANTNASNTK